ncbi:hypothetical protein [Oligoflexus tunisiensis]|uniref:hypothetical protein n=1 Tax=Oligoflexus tunisiensis TaxID=708132 RepID=UPI00114CBB2A|nr:hypothetical protein [Oligoflexus tunisiensis]
MLNYESDYTKWIEIIAAYLRQTYNRDYKTLPYAFELRYFSGYSTKDVIHELSLTFPDLHVKKFSDDLVERALRS